MQRQKNLAFLSCVLGSLVLIACSGDSAGDNRSSTGGTEAGGNAGDGGAAGIGGMTGTGGSVGSGGSAGVGGALGGCFPVLCADGNSYGCGDCMDNDDDGLIDDKDPECLGPATTPKA